MKQVSGNHGGCCNDCAPDRLQQCAQGLISEEQKLNQISQVIFGAGENAQAGVSAGQSIGLMLAITLLPCGLMLLSYFLYKKKYKLDEEEYDRICRELASREK